jgi:hypothetical protein
MEFSEFILKFQLPKAPVGVSAFSPYAICMFAIIILQVGLQIHLYYYRQQRNAGLEGYDLASANTSDPMAGRRFPTSYQHFPVPDVIVVVISSRLCTCSCFIH